MADLFVNFVENKLNSKNETAVDYVHLQTKPGLGATNAIMAAVDKFSGKVVYVSHHNFNKFIFNKFKNKDKLLLVDSMDSKTMEIVGINNCICTGYPIDSFHVLKQNKRSNL